MALIKDLYIIFYSYLLFTLTITLSIHGNSNMEFLTSNERMSAITIALLYFDEDQNVTGPSPEEGLAYREEIEIPFNIILSFSIILILSYEIHLNGHSLFRLLTRISLWIYHLLSRLHPALFYWYFIFTALDITESRDRKADQQILPVKSVPDIDALFTVYKLLSCNRTILMKFSAL